MLRSLVSAMAANKMLVQCNSDVPISLTCLVITSDSPEHGIIGTTSLRDLEGLQPSRQRIEPTDQLIFGAASGWNLVPSTQIRCRMTAMRRTKATMARLRPRRLAS